MTRLTSENLFFPMAVVHGAAAIGIWAVLSPGGITTNWHVHELAYGYAAAVIAGFLLTRTSRVEVAVAATLWLAARCVWLLPDAWEAARAVASMASTGVIVLLASRGFLRAVKRGQNAVFPVVLAAFWIGDAALQAGILLLNPAVERAAGRAAVMLVVLLVVVMGGRIAGAALSGLAQRAGLPRIPPQPRLERVLVATLTAVAVGLAMDLPALLAPAAWIAAGAITVRLIGWAPGLRLATWDLLSLVASQGFVALGLTGIGASALRFPWPESAPMHLVTIGGIGIATVAMMLKTRAQRARLPLPATTIGLATTLLGLSAAVRALGQGEPAVAYPIAGIAWIAAMLVSLVALLRR